MALGDFIGGQQSYDPALALMLVQNPEMVAAHLAARGHAPPADIPEGIDHQDAGQSLGRALQFAGGGFDQSTKGDFLPPGFQTPALGFVGTMDKPVDLPSPIQLPSPVQSPQDIPEPTNPARTAVTPAPESPAATGPAPPPTPTPPRITVHPRAPQDDGEDSSVPLPTPNPLREAEGGTDTGADIGKKAAGGLDTLATSLAGLHALPYQNPLHVYTPQAPHPSNMISRSTVPQTLMQELAAAGHPAAMFRLGEALRGKAYA